MLDEVVGNNKCTIQTLASKIAKHLHTEVMVCKYKEQNPEYLETILDEFNQRNINNLNLIVIYN